MSSVITHYLDKMTQNDKDFFKQLGAVFFKIVVAFFD